MIRQFIINAGYIIPWYVILDRARESLTMVQDYLSTTREMYHSEYS